MLIFGWTQSLLLRSLDLGLVLALTYMVLVIGERRTLWMVRIYYLDLASTISTNLRLMLLFCAGKVSDRLCRGNGGIFSQSFAGF